MPVITTGLRENAVKFRLASNGLKAEMTATVSVAQDMAQGGLRSYPPMRSTRYIRTGRYYQGVVAPAPEDHGSTVIGYTTELTPYSYYLRGTPDGSYKQSWIHAGHWQPLVDFIADLRAKVVDLSVARLVGYIKGVLGA